MFVNTTFSYNNISSDSMGVMLIHESSEASLVQKFSPDKATYKDRPRYKDAKTYFYGSDKQILILTIKVMKIDNTPMTEEDRVDLMGWLCPDSQFHAFISDDFPDLEFWIQFTKSSFTNYFSNQGFYTLDAESFLPYALCPIPDITRGDLITNTTSTMINIPNNSNVVPLYMPYMQFTMAGDTTFKIINHSNNNSIFQFTGLGTTETICVNNETNEIISSTGNERISAFNLGFLQLVQGMNQLEIFGRCTLTFKMSFPMQV